MENLHFKGFWVDSIVGLDLKRRNEGDRVIVDPQVVLVAVGLFPAQLEPAQEDSVGLGVIGQCEIEHVILSWVIEQIVLGGLIN